MYRPRSTKAEEEVVLRIMLTFFSGAGQPLHPRCSFLARGQVPRYEIELLAQRGTGYCILSPLYHNDCDVQSMHLPWGPFRVAVKLPGVTNLIARGKWT